MNDIPNDPPARWRVDFLVDCVCQDETGDYVLFKDYLAQRDALAAAEQRVGERNRCPDCRNEFIQPFVCITCGAQKLYDATLRSAESRAAQLKAALDAANAALRDANSQQEMMSVGGMWSITAWREKHAAALSAAKGEA